MLSELERERLLMSSDKVKIAVFVSGGGTNLQALIDAQRDGRLYSGEIVLVVSSNPGAYAIDRAAAAGISAVTVCKKDVGERFEAELIRVLEKHGIEMIVLAGFMSILSADFISRYSQRIINVHPSLIPSFCGKGMYGLHVHEAALAYGVKSAVPPSTMSTKFQMAVKLFCRRRYVCGRMIRRKACKNGL